jgi:FlaA1/EpsC-like NDP-sugar epimerase
MVDLRNVYKPRRDGATDSPISASGELTRRRPRIIVTGAAGFIGMHVAERLLKRGETVIGVDNFNDYYDPALKDVRAERLAAYPAFRMVRADISEPEDMLALVKDNACKRIVHLAAQAGVSYSIEHPFAYEKSNLAGHLSMLEACRHGKRRASGLRLVQLGLWRPPANRRRFPRGRSHRSLRSRSTPPPSGRASC